MTNKLPPLPEDRVLIDSAFCENRVYDAYDMQAYGQQCRDAALEEAALAVESGIFGHGECADKIRSLK